MATYDIVIRNGQVADGTGKKLFAADVALKGDRIAAVDAPGALKGDNEIDAKGKVVAPGFIDVHTHDDTALIDNPTMAMKASQGVTTVVCGNCGVSAAPYIRDDVGHFLSLIVKNKANISKSFAEFAGKVDAARPAINGAFLIGHCDAAHELHGRRSRPRRDGGRDQRHARPARPEPRTGRHRHVERAVLCRGQRRLDRRGRRGRQAARQVGRRLHRAHARRGRAHPAGDGRDLRDRPPRRRLDHRLAPQMLGPHQLRAHEGDAAQVHRGDEAAADRLRRLSLHRRLDDPAQRHAGARRQGADHLVGQGGRPERPRPQGDRQGDGLLDAARRPTASSRPAPSTS